MELLHPSPTSEMYMSGISTSQHHRIKETLVNGNLPVEPRQAQTISAAITVEVLM